MWIFLALASIPIIEIALFIKVGGLIGVWPTIALVILTAIIGGALLRAQGFAAMTRLQASLAEGGDPRGPLAHGATILLAGLLMLTPGFFTDIIGFLLLLPPVRAALIARAGPALAARTVFTASTGGSARSGRWPRSGSGSGPIDAEYKDLTDIDDPSSADSSDDSPAKKSDGRQKIGRSGWSRPPE